MKRINDLLNKDEVIKSELHPDFLRIFLSSRITVGSLFLFTACILGKISLGLSLKFLIIPIITLLFAAIPAAYNLVFVTYYITNQKVIIETGVIGRDYDIVKLDRVLDINLDAKPLDTIFGTGSIKLCTANDSEPMVLKYIRSPKKVIRSIQF